MRVNPLIKLDLILSLSKDEGRFHCFSAAWLVRLIRPHHVDRALFRKCIQWRMSPALG